MPKYDVIAVGSATVDVFVETHDEDVIDIRTAHSEEIYTCFELGSKILIDHLEFTTGGGGTNTAVSFKHLGLKTAYLGNIGKDINGDKILRMLKKYKIDSYNAEVLAKTGRIINVVYGHNPVEMAMPQS